VSDPRWATWPDDRLLELRLCELAPDLRVEGTLLEATITQLATELAARDLVFRPHFWLSDEFYTPDGVPGIALPFYLAHPRLCRLEEHQMLEVEGGTPDWCLRILRHEAGHAIDNAFALRRRPKRRKLFGQPSLPYPEYYAPRPYSRSFVLHLDAWYAQSHPDEDFAETFAVWLTPDANWPKRYAEWPALRKLVYMDQLMRELAGQRSPVRSKARVDPLERLRKTLAQHYAEKRKHYGVDYPTFYDRDLRRLFTDASENGRGPSATRFLRTIRRDVRRKVARWTGAYQYTIDQVFEDMVERCRELGLRLRDTPERTAAEFVVLLAVHTMNYLHSGRHRVAL
jgi:hypothetical protein